MDRETLGRIVRAAWVRYCIETGDTKPSHLAPWEQLSEWDKEVDMRIGEAVFCATVDWRDGQYRAITGVWMEDMDSRCEDKE